jgi:Skp family chaperone for outer membrane proteins
MHAFGCWILGATILCGLGSAGCPMTAGPLRVGWVDGTRVVRTTKRGKVIRKQIEVEGDKLEKKLAELQATVRSLTAKVKALRKQQPAKAAELKKQTKALGLARKTLRERHLRYQKELNAFGQRLLNEFKEAIRKVATEIKDRLGLDLVIMTSRGEGLWIWPVKDITDRVVQQMDAKE